MEEIKTGLHKDKEEIKNKLGSAPFKKITKTGPISQPKEVVERLNDSE